MNESIDKDTGGADKDSPAAIKGPRAHSDETMRVVMEAISEVADNAVEDGLFAGLLPADSPSVFRTLFGAPAPDGPSLDVVVSASDTTIVMVTFDLSRLRSRLARSIAGGIGRDTAVMRLVGDLPAAIRLRLEASHSDPRMAAHYMATAADHLVEEIRLRITDVLMPVSNASGQVRWTAAFDRARPNAWFGLMSILPLASRVDIVAGRDLKETSDV